jgi:hypothetical protein
MTNDVLIGTISGYSLEEIQYWVNSLDASGYAGDKVILACNAEHGCCKRCEAVITRW